MIPVKDLERARQFYEKFLGLEIVAEGLSGPFNPGILLQAGGSTQIFLFQRNHINADHTLISFLVEDIQQEVNELKARGIKFEEYNTLQLKTVDGIAEFGNLKGAWFNDSEGNNVEIAQISA
jgi:catechol 2,3-dioxygenase-like lactoylglutathione lyase family enzyme